MAPKALGRLKPRADLQQALEGIILSTICKIALRTKVEAVLPVIETFLRQRNIGFTVTETEWPAAVVGSTFICGDQFPSVLSVQQSTSEITEINFNSFATLSDLASNLSSIFKTHVVVNIYQSASSASYWALHSNGKEVRRIEGCESVVTSHSGDRLPFEGPEPGRKCEDDDGTFVWFDHGEQDWYNREVGIPVEVYQDCHSGCINFMIEIEQNQRKAGGLKPWWRLW